MLSRKLKKQYILDEFKELFDNHPELRDKFLYGKQFEVNPDTNAIIRKNLKKVFQKKQ